MFDAYDAQKEVLHALIIARRVTPRVIALADALIDEWPGGDCPTWVRELAGANPNPALAERVADEVGQAVVAWWKATRPVFA